MAQLRIETDWIDGAGIRGPELSATWASLRILADDSVVTWIHDARAQTTREHVFVPLYPFAEWLATNWWFLHHESTNPLKEEDPQFLRRHTFVAGREGYAFPNLTVLPSGSWTHLAWKRERSPWSRIEFLAEGETRVESEQFRASCADLIDQVVRRLDALRIDGTLLQEEWSAIQSADSDEFAFCAAVARLGWDPYAVEESRQALVMKLAEQVHGAVFNEAMSALDPNSLQEGCTAITDAIADSKSHGLFLERFQREHTDVPLEPAMGGCPWEAGYRWAQTLRRNLELDGTPIPTLKDLAECIGEGSGLLKIRTPIKRLQQAAMIDGVITRTNEQQPALGFRRLSEPGAQFHICRALAEVLTSPSTDTLLTKAHSERQQRNRAFAAEFLAPATGLQQRLNGRQVVDADDIDELASEFGVSSLVVEHQVRNHQLARIIY